VRERGFTLLLFVDKKATLESQINFLKSVNNSEINDGIAKLEQYRKDLDQSSTIIKNEAKTFMIYFAEFAKLIPEKGLLSFRKTITFI